MKRKSLLSITAGILMAATSGTAWAQQRCGGVDIANGPFAYTAATPNQGSFNGAISINTVVTFSVTAPSPNPNTLAPEVFPGQGQNTCLELADAHLHIHEIMKTADSQDNPLNPPVPLDAAGLLYQTIAAAFGFSPATTQFSVGETVPVTVTVSNPTVNSSDLGTYMVWMKAHAPGAGIGTGPGAVFTLELNPAEIIDNTPPNISIGKPAGDQILGIVPVEITATDPAPGTGVASISATINSLGGAVPLQALALTAIGLPQGAGSSGTPITATGTFAPWGATGTAGTTLASAFTSAARSGIGNYSISAQAIDGAGNIGFASNIFKIKYDVSFTLASVPNGCPGGNAANPNFNSCNGMFEFKAKRSNVTSDGAFMFDTTVVLKLVRTSDNVVVATHACTGSCTGGAIHVNVQINETNKLYKSHFKHSDLDADPNTAGIQAPTTLNEYRVDVYFMDVDGNQTFQGSSPALML